jgi:hypothetical protein
LYSDKIKENEVDWTCSMNGEVRIAHRILVEILNERDHLKKPRVLPRFDDSSPLLLVTYQRLTRAEEFSSVARSLVELQKLKIVEAARNAV